MNYLPGCVITFFGVAKIARTSGHHRLKQHQHHPFDCSQDPASVTSRFYCKPNPNPAENNKCCANKMANHETLWGNDCTYAKASPIEAAPA